MKARRALAPIAVGCGGLVLACLSAAVLLQIKATKHPPPAGLLFAATYAEAANDLLDQAWPTKDRRLLLEARLATERELALAPAHGAAWLRLAIVDAGLTGRLGGEGQTALARSYAVAPLNERLLASRIRLAYDHWSELTPDLRRQTLRHVEDSWTRRTGRAVLQRTLPSVSDPGGRLALRAKLVSLMRKARVEQKRREGLAAQAPGG